MLSNELFFQNLSSLKSKQPVFLNVPQLQGQCKLKNINKIPQWRNTAKEKSHSRTAKWNINRYMLQI